MDLDFAGLTLPFLGLHPLSPFPPTPVPPTFPPQWKWPPDRPIELPDIKVRWPIKYGPAKIKILIVTDWGGNYRGDEVVDFKDGYGPRRVDFGLGIMLKDAFDSAHPDHPDYARFEFTKAHRTQFMPIPASPGNPGTTVAEFEAIYGITPGYSNFKFSDTSLAGFHEVWLFGINTAQPYLQGTELTAITNFMNNNGGVLAMGDHEDLGLGLCGNIPRVKSMRKWWFNTVPPGELKAPDDEDLTRNDTVQLVNGMDPGFNGQEDDKPQPIYPNYRYGRNWWNPRRWFRYPHPVLCGPRGVITVFPDHAHEGDCIVPAVLDPAQYPGGVAPEVIATGRNVVGRNKNGFVISDPRPFGLLGAYDGHLVTGQTPGRILVDSTWHHWFNVNLFGLDASSIAAQTMEYRDILAYFRNVAVWLAPRERQERMRLTGQVIFLFTPGMIETTLTIRDFNVEKFILWGIEARDALGRLAPKCQANMWFIDWFAPFLPKIATRFALDPEKQPMPDPWEAYAEDYVFTTALGGAVAAMAIAARKSDYLEGDALIESADKIMSEGIRMGIDYAYKQLEQQTAEFKKHVETLRVNRQQAAQ
jgi:hypothetical protein